MCVDVWRTIRYAYDSTYIDRFDADHSGYISVPELQRGIAALLKYELTASQNTWDFTMEMICV